MVFSGRLDGEVTGDCPRCLDEFVMPVARVFRMVVERFDGSADGYGQAVSGHDGNTLDLSPLVVEEVLLGVDDTTPCRDDCRGLCSGCGTNLNRDLCTCD